MNYTFLTTRFFIATLTLLSRQHLYIASLWEQTNWTTSYSWQTTSYTFWSLLPILISVTFPFVGKDVLGSILKNWVICLIVALRAEYLTPSIDSHIIKYIVLLPNMQHLDYWYIRAPTTSLWSTSLIIFFFWSVDTMLYVGYIDSYRGPVIAYDCQSTIIFW